MLIINRIKNYFLNGLFSIIPIFLTFNLIKTIINILSGWLYPLNKIFGNKILFIYSEIIIAFILITIIGILFKSLFINLIVKYFETYIIGNIPIAKNIYSGIKKISNLIKTKNEVQDNVQMTAWVHLPYKGIYCLGLMTGKLDKDLAPNQNKNYYSFFIPHTPNPMSGYYVIIEEGDFVFTNMTRQEAMSMIISGGIIRPKK